MADRMTPRNTGSDGDSQPSARKVTLGVAAVAAGAAALLLLAGGGWTVLVGGAGAGAIWRNGFFLICGAITVVCVLGLAVLCGAMWAAGASARARREEKAHGQDARATQKGSAILEFVLVMPFAFFIVLLMIQSSLLMGGSLCVNYAAFCAARSAIVTVPLNLPDEPCNVVGDVGSSGKQRRIQMAAVWAVLPVSSASPDGPSVDASRITSGLSAVLGSSPSQGGDLDHRLGYAQSHTIVDLSPPANPANYDSNEDLTVRVRHDFYLSIPYAAWVFASASPDGMSLDFGRNQYAMVMQSQCTLTNEGERDYVDVERFPRDRFSHR